MPFDAGAITGEIILRYDKAVGALKAVEQQTKTSMGRMTAYVQKHQAAFESVGKSMMKAGAVVGAGLGLAVKQAADFEGEMRNVNAIMRQSENEFRRFSKEVLSLSTRLPVSAPELAKGLYQVASGGIAAADSMKVLEAAARAGVAGVSNTATAATALIAVLNAYRKTGEDAAAVSDVLFKTVELGVLTFQDLSGVIGILVSAASPAKISLEEVTAALVVMTRQGYDAAMSANALNRVILSFLDPQREFVAALKSIGIESSSAFIQTEGLVGAVRALAQVAEGNPAILASMGLEMRALRAAMALAANEGKLFNEMLEQQQGAAGATAHAFEEQSKSFRVQWDLMKTSLSAFQIQVGEGLIPLMKDLASTLTRCTKAMKEYMEANKGLSDAAVVLIAKLSAISIGLGAILFSLPRVIAGVTSLIGVLATPAGLIALMLALAAAITMAGNAWLDYWEKSRAEKTARMIEPALTSIEYARSRVQFYEKLVESQKKHGGAIKETVSHLESWRSQLDTLQQAQKKTTATVAEAASVAKATTAAGTKGAKSTADAMLDASQKALDWLRLQVDLAKAAGDTAAQHQLEATYLDALTRVWERWRGSATQARAELALSSKHAADEMRKAQAEAQAATEAFDEQLASLNALTEAGLDPLTVALMDLHPEFQAAIAEAQEMSDALNALTDTGIFRFQEQLERTLDAIGRFVPGFGFLRSEADATKSALQGLQGELVNLQWALAYETLSEEQVAAMTARVDEIRAKMEELANVMEPVAQKVSAIWLHVAENIHDAFADTFEGLMTGARRFQDFFADLANSIQRAFAQLVARMVADWLFGIDQMGKTGTVGGVLGGISNWIARQTGIAHMQAGGIVTSPTLAMVGEVPEVVMPLAQAPARPGASAALATAGGPPITVNLNVYAWDTMTGADQIMRNRKAIAAAVGQAATEGAMIGRRR